jgi:hypothetical protein
MPVNPMSKLNLDGRRGPIEGRCQSLSCDLLSGIAAPIPFSIGDTTMSRPANVWLPSDGTRNRTLSAIEHQIRGMGSSLFEIGLYKIDAAAAELPMMSRVWDAKTILTSASWLRYQNSQDRNIYIRPKGEHNLTLVDDLTLADVIAMKKAGFDPAVVVETSPANYQAWLKHPEQLSKALSTAAARALAERFDGDRGAAGWRHFGRLSGFTNRKPKHLDPATGLFPFVRLIEAAGQVYPEGERFLALVRQDLERQRSQQELLRQRFANLPSLRPDSLKSIEAFRAESRYGGDGTRIDLAYAIYAFSHGAPASEVQAAIRSRDLSHKGNERRQNEYVERTIKKALGTIERGR